MNSHKQDLTLRLRKALQEVKLMRNGQMEEPSIDKLFEEL